MSKIGREVAENLSKQAIFYFMILILFLLLVLLLWLLNDSDPLAREAAVIIIAGIFGNALYDQFIRTFSLKKEKPK
jgi:lipoprotein signal peptidase